MNQPPAGLRAGIKETKECAAAIAATLAAIDGAKADDGRVSRLEAFGFLRLAPEVFTAIVGVGAVPVELKDISPEELDDILGEFIRRGVIPDDPAKRDRLDIAMRIAWAIIGGVNEWQNISNPPRPDIVAEQQEAEE